MERGSRSLERCAHLGDRADRARHLAAQLRAGRLSRDQLRLAAYLRDSAAAAVLDEQVAIPRTDRAWVRALDVCGKPACVRVAAAALRVAIERCADASAKAEATLRAVEAWVACPCVRHVKQATGLALEAKRLGQAKRRGRSGLLQVAFCAGSAAGTKANPPAWVAWYAARTVAHAGALAPPEAIHEAVAAEVAPWVLGFGDPLAERARWKAAVSGGDGGAARPVRVREEAGGDRAADAAGRRA